MAILTKFAIRVEIDDDVYEIVAGEPGRTAEKEIESFLADGEKLKKERDRTAAKIQLLTGQYSANQALLVDTSGEEKRKLVKEQKEILAEIRTLSDMLESAEAELADVKKDPDAAAHMRFDAMVEDGTGKTALELALQRTDLSYARLVIEIRQLIAEARKKK